MNYNQLLRKIIDESDISLEEISRRCKAMGVPITSKYLSTLRKEDNRKTSEKKTKAIAKACGKHEDLLIIQAYYDKAPKTFKIILTDIRNVCTSILFQSFDSILSAPMMKELKKHFHGMSMAEFYTDIDNFQTISDTKAINRLIASINKTSNEKMFADALKNILSSYEINVDDNFVFESNSMSPTIPAGSRIITAHVSDLMECRNNDVLCYTDLKKDCIQLRRVKFLDNKHTKFLMLADNKDVDEIETLEAHDIRLIGKVTQIIVGIK